jgi:hypothetical protein
MITLREKTTISSATVRASHIAIATCIIDIITIFAEPFLSLSIYLDENNQLVRHEWFMFSYIFTFACVMIIIGIIIRHKKVFSAREFLTFIAYMTIPALGVAVHMFVEGLPINFLSITLAVMLYFAGIQSELSKQVKQKELELTECRVVTMLSQIKPHFLYNALTAIAQLCDEDPKKAKKATIDFFFFLQGNMESLSDRSLISIEKEMAHVKGYLDLEKAIYGNALNVTYNIQASRFLLPPLTIQPIVENAVRHGIGKKEGGGSITISINENKADYSIIVSDDGAGHDPTEPLSGKHKHLGIDNVRLRLTQCGGTIHLTGKIGKGTTVTIAIPKEYNAL